MSQGSKEKVLDMNTLFIGAEANLFKQFPSLFSKEWLETVMPDIKTPNENI